MNACISKAIRIERAIELCRVARTARCIAGVVALAAVGSASTFHVNAAAPAGGDGTSWATAFDDLQLALDAALLGDEIRVAAGRYVPTRRVDVGDPRSATFLLDRRLRLRGGFDPITGQHAGLYAQTLLDGDLGLSGYAGDNAYHVVTVHIFASIDGFDITRGYANGTGYDQSDGGGILCQSIQDPEYPQLVVLPAVDLSNCTLARNAAASTGGGLSIGAGRVNMKWCKVLRNHAAAGGGLSMRSARVSVQNCSFTWNSADYSGGGALLQSNDKCAFVSSVFRSNAAQHGAALAMPGSAGSTNNAKLHHCTFAYNVAGVSGSVLDVGAASPISNGAQFLNCILWGNWVQTQGGVLIDGAATAMHSIIEGNWPGPNFDVDPRFVNPLLGDLSLDVGSPAIDAGDGILLPQDPLDLDGDLVLTEEAPLDRAGSIRRRDDPSVVDTGTSRTGGAVVDLGAYEH